MNEEQSSVEGPRAGADAGEHLLTRSLVAELRRLARNQMARQPPGHTLQPTALVNEAFLKLGCDGLLHGSSRSRFVAVAARTMRQILIDHARRRVSRRHHTPFVELHEVRAVKPLDPADFLALEEALQRLEELHPRQARVIELRFYCGLDFTEIARELGLHEDTVRADRDFARAWLRRALAD